MTLPDLRSLTMPQLVLIAGGVVVVVGAILAMGSGGKGRGVGLIWITVPFLLAAAGLCVWLLMTVVKIVGFDF